MTWKVVDNDDDYDDVDDYDWVQVLKRITILCMYVGY